MEDYRTAKEYLLDELKRIDLILFYWVQKSRLQRQEQKVDEFRGLYISEEEISSLFAPKEEPIPGKINSSSLELIEEAIKKKADEIKLRRVKSEENGLTFPLDRLSQVFGLDSFDRETLLFCFAPELHLKYERIYAYLQDNVTKKKPTVDLLLALLCQNFEEKMDHRCRFCHTAPLVANQLVKLYDEPGTTHSPLLAKWVKVDDGIVDFLLGEATIDAQLTPFATLVHPEATIESLWLEQSVKGRLSDLGVAIENCYKDSSKGLFSYFSGPYGAGKRLAAEAISCRARFNLLTIDVRGLIASDANPTSTVDLILRETRLKDAVIYWANADDFFGRSERTQEWKNALFDRIRSFPGILIFGCSASSDAEFSFGELPVIRVEFPLPSYQLRRNLWQKHLRDVGTELGSADLARLSTCFRLTGGQIREIVSTAKANRLDGQRSGPISPDDLFDACRAYSRHKLVNLAVKVNPSRSRDDIILPKDQMEILREICNYVKHQPVVLDDWGFGEKLVQSKGLNVLFAGPSGTGKTMAAEILAGELGLDLYRIDLATVVSKYIGETEKNLNRIFREAEYSNAVLFFDEADAIFGKRSEVRDSHDRYANIEISYLLQKMEAYDGIAILATNLRKNLDQAFLRRMHFTVEFPMPEGEDRLKIWRLCFPAAAPLAKDIDLKFLAKRFKISGGNIKNIAVASAFHAAENGGKIGMTNLIHATKREFQKMGKLIVESDFGEF